MAEVNLQNPNHSGVTFVKVGNELRAEITAPPGSSATTVKNISGASYTVIAEDLNNILWVWQESAMTINLPATLGANAVVTIAGLCTAGVTLNPQGGSELYPTITMLGGVDPITGFANFSATLVGRTDAGTYRWNVLIPHPDDGRIAVNAQTGTAYTLVLADRGKLVTRSNASANTLTIPTNANVAFPVNTVVAVQRLGAGVTTVQGAAGVTVNGVSAGSVAISTQYASLTLRKTATNTWVIS